MKKIHLAKPSYSEERPLRQTACGKPSKRRTVVDLDAFIDAINCDQNVCNKCKEWDKNN